MGSPEPTDNFDLLFGLYCRSREEMGHYDAALWQIPTISYALNGVLLGLLINQEFEGWGAVAIVVTLIVLAIPLTAALVKNRNFQEARLAYARAMFRRLTAMRPGGEMTDIPTTTWEAEDWLEAEEIGDEADRRPFRFRPFAEGLFQRVPAYELLLGALLLTHLAQGALLVFVLAKTV